MRHPYLTEQLAKMQVSACIYNWIIAFLENRSHCTKFNGSISTDVNITPVLYRDRALVLSNFLITISKLKATDIGNRLLIYADDSYLMTLSSNSVIMAAALEHVAKSSETCNLKLNQKRTYEMIIRLLKGRAGQSPRCHPGVTGVKYSLNVLMFLLFFTEILNF